jgi:hypothetical protein
MCRPSILLVVAAVALGAGAGCSRCAPGGRTDAGVPLATCETRRAEIRTLIEKGSRACRTNADCRSYPGGPVDCGGAVDGPTAAKLWKLTDAFRAQGCRFAVHCAPRAVRAECQEGRCLEKPIGGAR